MAPSWFDTVMAYAIAGTALAVMVIAIAAAVGVCQMVCSRRRP